MLFLIISHFIMCYDNYKDGCIKLSNCNSKKYLKNNDSKYITKIEFDQSMIHIDNIYNMDIVHIYGIRDEKKKYYLNVTNLNNKTFLKNIYCSTSENISIGDNICVSEKTMTKCCNVIYYNFYHGIAMKAVELLLVLCMTPASFLLIIFIITLPIQV